ncbi:glycosyltransferase family 2 protein [Algoriphagus confluentis]|uniref:Glycosyltransferase family A protein n=1 Tax=Algoriphagus confluentis TaxID=1697556 RepID=A0ABQ6PKQ2_9BACT|nr:glycosyltransferase family A protein [Algoriphagus confluentis]
MKFCVIVPIYNEGKFLLTFLNSIISQTILLDKVICVDDNSTDNSAEIVKEFSKRFSFIQYLFHKSGDYKVQGKKVINAFNFGLNTIDLNEFDTITKMDADLELPVDYFEKIFTAFQMDNKIGVAGGRILEFKDGVWSSTVQADYHIRGALKTYRVSCFKEIGGLQPVLGWDGLDEMNAMYLGWKTRIIDSDVKHFRPASSDYNKFDMAFKIGYANYANGSNISLTLIRFLTKSFRFKSFSYGFYFLKGYFTSYYSKSPKNVDNGLAKFINNFHLKRIFKLK